MAVIFIFFITNTGYSQSISSSSAATQADTPGKAKESIKADSTTAKSTLPGTDSLIINDSLAIVTDTSKTDTSKKKYSLEETLGIKISKDALTSVVKAESRDSAVLNMEDNIFYLYGKAKTNYEDLELTSGQISYQQSTNIVSAAPYEAGKDADTAKQTFTQGKEKFTYDSLQYNFKSKRAIVRNAHTQYGEGFVHSDQVKRNPDQSIYGFHSIYTTCALDTPHFGIVAKKIKVIPGKVIISGPADLYIEDVPTPLWVPFGLFPVSQKQKSGFIMPTYTIEEQRGLGLLNGGYYFHINDYVDLLTQANLYSKGSYALSGVSDYRNLYHYNGMLNFSYAYNKTGENFEPGASIQKDFMIKWQHQSDAKAIPGQSFNASVQAGTSSFYSNNSYDPNQILQNQYSSNISYSKNFQNKPFGFTISALHSQNTATKQINVTVPSVNFYVSQLTPFQSKNAVGIHWYDKITASYTMNMENRTTFYDSTFSLSNLAFNDFKSGVHHSIPVSASYTILRYVQMSFSVNYNEYWYKEKLYEHFDEASSKIDSVNSRGFFAARDFNAGVNFSTRIYGMKVFKKGQLRGIRHVLYPSVGFTYHPDFALAPFNYYYRTRLDTSKVYTYQSPFASSIVGMPPLGKAGLITFGLNNNLQIKVRSSRDKDTATGYRNIPLIDALGVNVAYNPAVDSFQWSLIRANFATNILDKININSSASFDPYAFDYTLGRTIPVLMETKGYGLARFTNANLSLGTNIHSKTKGGAGSPTNSEEYNRILRNAGYNDYVDFNIPWSLNVDYSIGADNRFNTTSRRDTLTFTQSLMFRGELLITKNWKLNVSSGYDFVGHALAITSIDLHRDLHCWAMHLQAIPFGPRKSYTFNLNVKSTVLQDLKLMRRRDYRDTPY